MDQTAPGRSEVVTRPDWRERRVTVMGLGRFGGGVGVTRWLAQRGARVLVTDLDPESKLAESLAQLEDLRRAGRVTLRLGGHDERDFAETDAVIANAAVPRPWENRFLNAARAAGVEITTEINLLVEQIEALHAAESDVSGVRVPARARIIGVTGSVGKSTTTALIHHVLRASGRTAVVGGNLGGSLLGQLEEALRPRAWVVLELSSAMLYWLGARRGGAGWSPGTAVVTNLAPNHLDWHGSLDHYRVSKQQLLRAQGPGDIAVLGAAPGIGVADWPLGPGVERIVIRAEAGVPGLRLPGMHNAWNAAVAVAAVRATVARVEGPGALDEETARRHACSFGGLPHRLALVGSARRGGAEVRFFNDSKSTTPESTLLGVQSFGDGVAGDQAAGLSRVHLIAGGYDKGADLTPVAALAPQLAGLYTVGKTGPRLANGARACGGQVTECGTVDAATRAAWERARGGDVILLSPACASWDQFENYEKRGELFERMARELCGDRT